MLILGVLAILACFAGWYCVRQLHENAFKEELENALGAHASGNDRAAEELLKALLPKAEEWWPQGPHHLETLCWLATIQRGQHEYEVAEPEFRQVVTISEQQGATSTTAVGRAKLGLGIIARDETEEAQSYLVRAITGYESLPYNVPQGALANAHFELAEVYRHLDEFDSAAEQYKAALELYVKVEGPSGRDARNAATGLAIVQQSTGDASQANTPAQPSSAVENSSDLDGASLNNLANVALEKKQYAEAESLYKKAAAAFEKSGGPNDLGLGIALDNLGKLYRDVSQFNISKAETPLKRALAIRENALGAEHPETAKVLSDLSLLYFYEKKPAAAVEFAERALPVEEKTFGAESLQVSTTLNRLGIAQRDEGKFTEAELSLKRALAIRETKQAPQSWIAISLANLASVYQLEGQETKAIPLITRARLLQTHSSNN